ncbi:MAG: hypothetical protein DCF20_04065 [Pseudanabaena sp.]|nr:MAG: hypothetical protein DCF20_04065 [Pseudanabaena sp.]
MWDTIREWKNEIENTVPEKFNEKAIRVRGGGRKSCFKKIPELDQAFQRVVQEHAAGEPMQAEIKWIYLNQAQIVAGLKQLGIEISMPIVRQLLDRHNYVKRKAKKQLATGETANRYEEFENINDLKQEYKDTGNPIMSIDTKKSRSSWG